VARSFAAGSLDRLERRERKRREREERGREGNAHMEAAGTRTNEWD
jgi:hypothetical protein